jgi:hypothetical protein
MALVGPALAVLVGVTWVGGVEFCATAESAKRQEKAPVNTIPPQVDLARRVFIGK